MTKPESAGKPFDISKWDVWEAYKKVKNNRNWSGLLRRVELISTRGVLTLV